ncbi:MAG: NTP transferase domain-containing protein [Anaerolineales bacterium]|nr:NTP transferase domain-containing protein [Anaerolineales bacterium]
MLDHHYAVIMAGGSGTRLWPLSRQTRPKQMLRLIADDSLFQVAVKRLNGLFPAERICVVTVAEQARELQAQCPEIPAENFIIEPMPRGTASVVGLAAVALKQRDPQAVMAILTADHFIADVAQFQGLLRAAFDVAQDGYLVTLGITPTFPATGYGYIQSGEQLGVYQSLAVFRALKFKEKPTEAQASQMISTGDHAWNSGMFVWKVARILEEFSHQMPGLFASLQEIDQAWGTAHCQEVVGKIWTGLRSESIDYGIMEGARNVAVILAAGLGWNDVGSWDALFDVLPGDSDGNIVMGGEHIGIDTHASLIYVDRPHRLIVTLGVDDLVVVDTGDVLLVCRKDQAQKVRQVVEQLKKTNRDYL